MKGLSKFILLVMLLVQPKVLPGQDTIITPAFTDVALVEDSIRLVNCVAFIDSNNSTAPENIRASQWKPLQAMGIKKHVPAAWVGKRLYLQLNIHNSAAVADSLQFLPGFSFRKIQLYLQQPGGNLLKLEDQSKATGYQPLVIPAGTKQTYIAELYFTKSAYNYLHPQLIKQDYWDKYQKIHYYKNAGMQVAGYLFSGILLMMFIYSMANFVLSGKKEFVLNGCYVICMFLLIFGSTCVEKTGGVFTSLFHGYIAFALLSLGTIFYIAFTRKFLNTSSQFPLLDKLFKLEEKLFLLVLIGFTILYFFTNYFALQHALENAMKIIALAIGIVYIIAAFHRKQRLLTYLAIGNAMLIFFSIISFLIMQFPAGRATIFKSSLFYYELGIVCELLFFVLGLTYKNRVELIEKTMEQESLKLEGEKQSFETKLAVINAKEKERNRISTDMHDELGAGITAIRLYSELAKSKSNRDVLPEIEKISSSANELLVNMNAIIWAMSSSNDSLENMVAYIRSYSTEYFENTGVRCRINIMEGLPDIAVWGEMRKNIFLVIKETLNNILKHANATEVNITLTKVPGGLSLFIQDNGIGINLATVRRFGNGLKNMKKRMDEMNIEFKIENNQGTLVTLHYAIEL